MTKKEKDLRKFIKEENKNPNSVFYTGQDCPKESVGK